MLITYATEKKRARKKKIAIQFALTSNETIKILFVPHIIKGLYFSHKLRFFLFKGKEFKSVNKIKIGIMIFIKQ